MENEQKPQRGRPKTLDADKTLRTAMQAYWRADPADVSINAICAQAGVSKPSLYREFGSEDGLMRAALERYADEVLSDIFTILAQGAPLEETFDSLVRFVSEDERMETGCLFYKMRAGRHRLGPLTLERVEQLDAGAVEAFAAYLESRRQTGDWACERATKVVARYLVEQIGLAFAQRASGADPDEVHQTLSIALSAI